jgi:hypothetical protein
MKERGTLGPLTLKAKVEDIPTLPAYDDGGNYKVWCEYCRVWHLHGRMNGHRVAHCYWPLSPYNETGYFIQLAGDWKERPPHRERRPYRDLRNGHDRG